MSRDSFDAAIDVVGRFAMRAAASYSHAAAAGISVVADPSTETMDAVVEEFFDELRADPWFKALPAKDIKRAHVAAAEAMLRTLYGLDNGFAIDLYDQIRRAVNRKDVALNERLRAIGEILQSGFIKGKQ